MSHGSPSTHSTDASTAVLLLAYGAPESLADVPEYLHHVRGGRHVSPELVDEISDRYRQIGGSSPLPAITRRLAARLSAHIDLPVYIAMRHWSPFITDVTAQMLTDGIQRVKAICLTPHFSDMSVGAYHRALDKSIADSGQPIEVDFHQNWGDHPTFIAGVAHQVHLALAKFEADVHKNVIVAFTAHSLPQDILASGDPYPQQLMETCRLLAQRLHLPADRWLLAYQSAGRSDARWLGPSIEEKLPHLAAQGERRLLVAPIGFVCDNLEILYDIDIALQHLAQSYGMHLERTPMLNDSDGMLTVLSHLVRTPSLPPQDSRQ